MKLVDKVGTEIREGQLLFWLGPNVKCVAKSITQPGLVDMAKREVRPGELVLER